jgi:hypothetical protein
VGLGRVSGGQGPRYTQAHHAILGLLSDSVERGGVPGDAVGEHRVRADPTPWFAVPAPHDGKAATVAPSVIIASAVVRGRGRRAAQRLSSWT